VNDVLIKAIMKKLVNTNIIVGAGALSIKKLM